MVRHRGHRIGIWPAESSSIAAKINEKLFHFPVFFSVLLSHGNLNGRVEDIDEQCEATKSYRKPSIMTLVLSFSALPRK